MPIEVGIWRIDKGVQSVSFGDMGQEMQLQQIIADDISIIDPRLMVIGREVETAYGGRIDLLAIDADGNLSVIELKREKTSREVVSPNPPPNLRRGLFRDIQHVHRVISEAVGSNRQAAG